MGLFDYFRRKASEAGPLIVANNAGQAQWTERNLALYLRDGYQRNPVVYRCVRLIAENAASIPLMAMRGETEIEKHAVLDLLRKPNPFISGRALLTAAYSFRLVTGNAYIEAVQVGARVAELHVHRPDRVLVVPGPRGAPMAYEFKVNGQSMRFPVDEVSGSSPILHLRDFSPLNDWYGMSPLDPGSWAVDAHGYGSREIATTLSKGGVPVGAFQHDGPESQTQEQIIQARETIIERLTQSRRDRFPAVFNKFWKWINIGLGPKELGVTELKADAAREVCFAYGVPPMLLGIPGDNTYSNYQEANRAFWRETVIPFAESNLEAIGNWLGTLSGERDFSLKPNLDNIVALMSERSEQWDMLNKAEFVTVNEKREATGYKPAEGGDVVLVASSDVPLADAGTHLTGGTEPNDGADAEDSADQQQDQDKIAADGSAGTNGGS
ncbi:phage portal protein [Sphingomonas daechungensis]|uniref:phage portal protein n=1 Tax=Sphingomonas daechungensis TaxID=1176646 RepID=UPI0037835B93